MYFDTLSAHGTSSRIDHILGHKSGLNQYKKTEIIYLFSDQNTMKPEVNNKKKNLENYKCMEAKRILLENE